MAKRKKPAKSDVPARVAPRMARAGPGRLGRWVGVTSVVIVATLLYLVVGWIGAVAFPHIVGTAGIFAGLLIAVTMALQAQRLDKI